MNVLIRYNSSRVMFPGDWVLISLDIETKIVYKVNQNCSHFAHSSEHSLMIETS